MFASKIFNLNTILAKTWNSINNSPNTQILVCYHHGLILVSEIWQFKKVMHWLLETFTWSVKIWKKRNMMTEIMGKALRR